MSDPDEPEVHCTASHKRQKASFAPSYMTAFSVIQSVSLADLRQVVAASYTQLTSEQWLLAAPVASSKGVSDPGRTSDGVLGAYVKRPAVSDPVPRQGTGISAGKTLLLARP